MPQIDILLHNIVCLFIFIVTDMHFFAWYIPLFLVDDPTGKLPSLNVVGHQSLVLGKTLAPDVWDEHQRNNRRISFADTGQLECCLIVL